MNREVYKHYLVIVHLVSFNAGRVIEQGHKLKKCRIIVRREDSQKHEGNETTA